MENTIRLIPENSINFMKRFSNFGDGVILSVNCKHCTSMREYSEITIVMRVYDSESNDGRSNLRLILTDIENMCYCDFIQIIDQVTLFWENNLIYIDFVNYCNSSQEIKDSRPDFFIAARECIAYVEPYEDKN